MVPCLMLPLSLAHFVVLLHACLPFSCQFCQPWHWNLSRVGSSTHLGSRFFFSSARQSEQSFRKYLMPLLKCGFQWNTGASLLCSFFQFGGLAGFPFPGDDGVFGVSLPGPVGCFCFNTVSKSSKALASLTPWAMKTLGQVFKVLYANLMFNRSGARSISGITEVTTCLTATFRSSSVNHVNPLRHSRAWYSVNTLGMRKTALRWRSPMQISYFTSLSTKSWFNDFWDGTAAFSK